MKPRVRFAPSPTGELHLGGVRTALTNFLFTKKHQGTFLIRIEDTDHERSRKEYIDQICDSLQWLGLQWDEEISFQSDRGLAYEYCIAQLINTGHAYRCFCSKEELELIRKETGSFLYNGIWRGRKQSEINNEIKKGTPFTIRLATPDDGVTEFEDMVYGKISISNTELDDFIIARSDGSPVYNFTNVVDDKNMNISHVIRGEDHISNTPKQILIYEALGYDVPNFAHLPMILGDDKKRLSKRHGATGVHYYRDSGYQPNALINYLALLGWNPGTEKEIFNLDKLIEEFDLSKVQKKSAIFDHKKFHWVSSQHLILQDNKDVLSDLIDIDKQWSDDEKQKDYLKLINIMKHRSHSLKDLIERSQFFFHRPMNFDEKNFKKVWVEGTNSIMQDLKKNLEFIDSWVSSELEIKFNEFINKKELGYGKIMRPLRFALCGNLNGPSLFDIMELLGKKEFKYRLNYIINEFRNNEQK